MPAPKAPVTFLNATIHMITDTAAGAQIKTASDVAGINATVKEKS